MTENQNNLPEQQENNSSQTSGEDLGREAHPGQGEAFSNPQNAESSPEQRYPQSRGGKKQEEPPKRIHRVGTFTLGLTLIVVGVLTVYTLLNPSFDYTMALKLSPLVLVSLGIEVLISSFLSNTRKIKYDFLSGFVSILLILGSMGIAALQPLYENYGPYRSQVSDQMRQELYEDCYNQVKDMGGILSLSVWVHLDAVPMGEDFQIQDMKTRGDSTINMQLEGPFRNRQEFAQKCEEILGGIRQMQVLPGSLILHYTSPEATEDEEEEGTSYHLELEGSLQYSLTAESLAKLVNQ